jgi:hypothetical protein
LAVSVYVSAPFPAVLVSHHLGEHLHPDAHEIHLTKSCHATTVTSESSSSTSPRVGRCDVGLGMSLRQPRAGVRIQQSTFAPWNSLSCRSGALLAEAIAPGASLPIVAHRPDAATRLTELAGAVVGNAVEGRNADIWNWNPRWHTFYAVQVHLANDDTGNEPDNLERLNQSAAHALAILGPDVKDRT